MSLLLKPDFDYALSAAADPAHEWARTVRSERHPDSTGFRVRWYGAKRTVMSGKQQAPHKRFQTSTPEHVFRQAPALYGQQMPAFSFAKLQSDISRKGPDAGDLIVRR